MTVYPRLPKPAELVALHDVAEELFEVLREAYSVPPELALSLRDVDRTGADHLDLVVVRALWEVQTLRVVAKPGTPVLNADVVNTATVLASVFSLLAARPESQQIAPLLGGVLDEIHRAARVAADLGHQHGHSGIVEMA